MPKYPHQERWFTPVPDPLAGAALGAAPVALAVSLRTAPLDPATMDVFIISEPMLFSLGASWLPTLTGLRLAAVVADFPDFADLADLTDLADLAVRTVSRETWGILAELGGGEAPLTVALERRRLLPPKNLFKYCMHILEAEPEVVLQAEPKATEELKADSNTEALAVETITYTRMVTVTKDPEGSVFLGTLQAC